ncbi:hypothetical protein [Psychrobacillus phage Perkons]|nr:hypothetical protein [Psychrobacillus phage Perkons]
MDYKIKTITALQRVAFDDEVNEFVANNIVNHITFCTNNYEYVAHIQYLEGSTVRSRVKETQIKPNYTYNN